MSKNSAEKNFLIVGITGRSGSGKTTVSQHYAALGYPVADGDVISRQVVLPASKGLAELVEGFGPKILTPAGELDRKGLGAIAFSSPENNQKLIDILHPHIIREFLRQDEEAKQAGSPLFFVDGAVIVGGPFQPYCDKLVVLLAGDTSSVGRITRRDGIAPIEAEKRLAAQQPEAALRAAADYIIENDADLPQLLQKADEVLRQLLCAAGKAGEGPG
ncbi:dephospho-CoA kinase [Ruminococcaceae bacterium OttesenSCG-928-O06]|nr:dephospho-CoA kinase [Ruminococcaceae bacterium OttesenSCG-928-O06]